MKTFVFAIGGTGARVLRALSVLLAMDFKINQEIIPILIDMDTRNGDAQRALQMLDLYRYISQHAYEEKPKSGFFTNHLGTLGSIQVTGNSAVDQGIKDSFQLDFGDINVSFYDYIKGSQLSKLDNDLLASLFNNADASDPDTELNLKLNHGFKGNPNIGSVVFNNLINTPEFKHFENVFSQNDRIFIISSIFGGTGSSGFPQLIKNIRASNNNFVKNAVVGAVVVNPYFRVKKDAKSSIDSDTFNSKTKSALTYYSEELDGEINEVYYLADEPGDALENKMGGDEQKNNAHIVELLAAKAVANFVNRPAKDLTSKTFNYYEYGIKDAANANALQELGFQDFYDNPLWTAFAKFYLFVKFYREGIKERANEAFYKDLNLAKELREKYFYIRLTDYLEGAWEWVIESEKNKRSFSPFNLNSSFSKFIKGKNVSSLDKGFFKDEFTKVLNQLWKKLKEEGKISNEEKFLKMNHQCINKIFDSEVQALPTRS